MWNYIFYIAYLDFKDETEYNGIESYIYKKIKIKKIDWFPIGKSLQIKDFSEGVKNPLQQI
jgi:inositol 1,4,5-triphosphate receptor type 1/inositol 1,4,5-triphosphate receptor type 3